MALEAMDATTAHWSGQYLGGSTPLKSGRATMSLDGGLVSTPLGEFADPDFSADKIGGGFMRVWRTTNQQDVVLCEGTQAGVSSRPFVPGPLHPDRESAVRSALDTYLELMSR
jgi:Ring hydroxylating alpha subunit (catalytic domain)